MKSEKKSLENNKEYFKIYRQGNICDSWFPYEIPLSINIEWSLKKIRTTIKDYRKIVESLRKDIRFSKDKFRIYKVTEELVEEL